MKAIGFGFGLLSLALSACALSPVVDAESGLTTRQQTDIILACARARGWNGPVTVETIASSGGPGPSVATATLAPSADMPASTVNAINACVEATKANATGQPEPVATNAPASASVHETDFRGNLMREVEDQSPEFGCNEDSGTLQRATLICTEG